MKIDRLDLPHTVFIKENASMLLKRFGAVALGAIVWVGLNPETKVQAGLAYDNLAQAVSGFDNVATPSVNPLYKGPLADSFTTSALVTNFSQVTLALRSDSTHLVPTGSLTVTLRADSATAPGAIISVLGTLSDTALSSTVQNYTFNLDTSPPIRLQPNTRYWIQVQPGLGGDSGAQWAYGSDNSGVGVANEFFANSGGVFSNIDGPYLMQVNTTVPEPSSLILVGLGLAGLAAGRLKRQG